MRKTGCATIHNISSAIVLAESLKNLDINTSNPAIIFTPKTFCIIINPIINTMLKNIILSIISNFSFLIFSIKYLIIPYTPKNIKYKNDILIGTKKKEIKLDDIYTKIDV